MELPETDSRPGPAGGLVRLRNLIWLGHGVNDTHIFILPLILPVVLLELRLPFVAAGLLVSGFLFAMALSSYVAGRVSDRLSASRILGFGFLAAAVFLAAAGLAPGPLVLVICVLLAGLGVGQVFGIMTGVLSLTAALSPAIYGRLSDRLGLEQALRVLLVPAAAGWLMMLLLLACLRPAGVRRFASYSSIQSERPLRKALRPDSST